MAGRKSAQEKRQDLRQDGFEGRFFDQLQDSITEVKEMGKSLGRKIDDNTEKTEKGFKELNGRVRDLETSVYGSGKATLNTVKDIAWYKDPGVQAILKMLATAILIGVAAWAGADVSGLI